MQMINVNGFSVGFFLAAQNIHTQMMDLNSKDFIDYLLLPNSLVFESNTRTFVWFGAFVFVVQSKNNQKQFP